MSDFVEKTLGSLSTLFGSVGLVSSDDNKTKRKISSMWNFDKTIFINKLKSAASKKEEETIVLNFLTSAEKQLSQPNVNEAELEIYVQLVMICGALGFPAPFIYVHAIKLAQKGNLLQKNTGYLAAASLLHPQHELAILLINTIQKDLDSSNCAEVLLGLKAVCNLINEDTVHNVLYLVEQRLKHENSEVRKLAALTLGHCLQVVNSESAYKIAFPKLEKALVDSDLGVVSAVISVLYTSIKNFPGDYGYLCPTLIQLQNQLLQRQLPSYMEYQSIPAPWLQIKILKFFPLLCKSPEQSSAVFLMLKATLQKAEINHSIAYAIIAEIIETIVNIEYNDEMVQLALSAAGKLLKSESSNLKYMGVQAFTTIIQQTKPSLNPSQQESIMECLQHSDETLKLKTLELLYHLVNPSNAQIICRRIIEHMTSQRIEHIKKDLALRALEIANQYNKDSKWYIGTINMLLLNAGDLIPPDKISDIIDIIQEDVSGDLKATAKTIYIAMCHEKCPPSSIMKIISSVLDESDDFEIILPYLEKADNAASLWILISLRNTIARTKKAPDKIIDLLKSVKVLSQDAKQTRSEILGLVDLLGNIQNLQLKDAVDVTMSHLDDYVCEALSNGLPCYRPQRLRVAEVSEKTDFEHVTSNTSEISSISWDQEVKQKNFSSTKSLSYNSVSSSSLPIRNQSSTSESLEFNVKNIWTKEGRLKDQDENREDLSSPFEQVSDENMETAKQIFAGVS